MSDIAVERLLQEILAELKRIRSELIDIRNQAAGLERVG